MVSYPARATICIKRFDIKVVFFVIGAAAEAGVGGGWGGLRMGLPVRTVGTETGQGRNSGVIREAGSLMQEQLVGSGGSGLRRKVTGGPGGR